MWQQKIVLKPMISLYNEHISTQLSINKMPKHQKITTTRVRKINPNHKQDMDWLKMLRVDCRTKTKADPNWGFTVNILPRLGKNSPHLQDYIDGKYAPKTRFNVHPEHAAWFDVYIIQYAKQFSRQTAFDEANGIERNPLTDFHSLYMLGNEECERLVGLFSIGREKYFEKMRTAGTPNVKETTTNIQPPVTLSSLIAEHISDYNSQTESVNQTQRNVTKSYLKYDLNIRDEKEMSFVHFLTQTGTWFVTHDANGCVITNEPVKGQQVFTGYQMGSFTNLNGQFASKLFSNGTWKIEHNPEQGFVVTPISEE